MLAKHVFAILHTRRLLLSLLVVALLMSTFLTASAQSSVYLPQITNGSQPAQAGPLPEETSDMDQQTPDANEEAPVSAAAYNATNWYVSNRVGVGTDLPAHQLSVIGGPGWTTANWVGSVELANKAAIGWRANSANQRFGMGHTTLGFAFFRTTSNPGTTSAAATFDMVIDNSGKVGLGTTTPAHHLSIAGGPLWTSNHWSGAVELTNASAIGWQVNAAGMKHGIGQSTGGFYFFRTSSNPGTTTSPAIYDMVINDDGGVGIGTTNPQYPLDVNGQIHASGNITSTGVVQAALGLISLKSIYADHDILAGGDFYSHNIKLTVPDYVFEPDYPLLSLDQLRAYVQREKHLPNVPDAAQIHQGGLNLSQFQMKLLEKTEELTLYTLAQDKQLTTQQEQLAMQDAQLTTLQQEMATLQQQNAALLARLDALEANCLFPCRAPLGPGQDREKAEK